MNTLLLDVQTWDLTKTAAGNIATAYDSAPVPNPQKADYALAQDAASAIKLFQGELYFDTTQGVPYWGQILGKLPPISLMKAKFVAAALTVPGVISAQCFISSITNRKVSGQVQIKSTTGTAVASF
jgi:hypothetical protein